LLKSALNELAATENGQIVLAWLKIRCNWDMTLMSDKLEMTQHHASIRSVYGALRGLIEPRHLKSIEFDYVMEPTKAGTTNDRPTKRTTGKQSST